VFHCRDQIGPGKAELVGINLFIVCLEDLLKLYCIFMNGAAGLNEMAWIKRTRIGYYP
jgi:hypothetical protein